MSGAPVILTLQELLARRATMVRRWTLAVVATAVLGLGAGALLVGGAVGASNGLLLTLAVCGGVVVTVGGVLPFVEVDRRRSARAARAIAAEGAARGEDPAPAAELVLTAGRPGRILWGGRIVGSTEGPALTGVVPRGEAIRPPGRRIAPGGDQYRWLRLELHVRRYLLMGMTRLHLVDDTARCWPLPRAEKVDDTVDVRLLLPADLDGVDVVTVLRAATILQRRVELTRQQARALS